MSSLVKLDHKPRIAIVHDALVNTGGAERVLTFMHETFPDALIFTAAFLPSQTYSEFRSAEVHTLPGSRFVRSERQAKRLLLLWMLGFACLKLDDFDIVLSSTTWGAKFIRPSQNTRHVCYCYAPFRLLWNPTSYNPSSLQVGSAVLRLIDWARLPLRRLDYQSMQRPARLATTCRNMAKQIGDFYNRSAQIIYAPIRIRDYPFAEGGGNYYLTVSRLVSHKRVDLAVKACQALGRRLIVVGDGPERSQLESFASDTMHFVGRISDPELKRMYSKCRAVIFPSDEDYGLVPLESQACGRPVIAYGSGGALETVIEGQTGVFFTQQTPESVIESMLAFEAMQFDPQVIRQSVHRFDVEHFKRELREFVLNP